MSSYAAKALLICAFASFWILARDHARTSHTGNPPAVYCSESDDGKQSYAAQLVCYFEPPLCLSLEPAPDFAALSQTTGLDIDDTVSVVVRKRGPPAIDS